MAHSRGSTNDPQWWGEYRIAAPLAITSRDKVGIIHGKLLQHNWAGGGIYNHETIRRWRDHPSLGAHVGPILWDQERHHWHGKPALFIHVKQPALLLLFGAPRLRGAGGGGPEGPLPPIGNSFLLANKSNQFVLRHGVR